MAILASGQIRLCFGDGLADGYRLLAVSNCNTGDIVDCSQWFYVVKLAVVLWTTTAKSDKLAPPVSGSQVTLATTGLVNDAGFLSVWGSVIP